MAGPSGATPRLTLPYPIPGDTVDVPRDIQALAQKLDGIQGYGVPLLSALPSSPADGAIVDLQTADMAAHHVVWRFRYVAAEGRWDFIGGPPLQNESAAAFSTSGAHQTYQGLAGDCTVLVPVSGLYDVTVGAFLMTANVLGNSVFFTPAGAGVAAVDNNAAVISTPAAQIVTSSSMTRTRLDGPTLIGGQSLGWNLRSSSANTGQVSCSRRRLILEPVSIPG